MSVSRDAVGASLAQAPRLRRLLETVLASHGFYAEKIGPQPRELAELPFTTKMELLAEQQSFPPYGRLLTHPPAAYTRFHQTSGTHGVPLRWLDTPASWEWMLGCWGTMLDMIGLGPDDRCLFPFSFGPFLGFWTAFDAVTRRGCLAIPAGGLSSMARVQMLLDHHITVVFCTPTYALHLADSARAAGTPLNPGTPGYQVRALIVAGEPGGSIPATRARLEAAWHARVFDHYGLTEVGPCAVECLANPAGLHILEEDYIAEIVNPQTLQPVAVGERGELVLTNLGRSASPVIRYRTGDLVQQDATPCPCGSPLLRLAGGVLGRADDMMCIRGNNFYPSALENVVREFAEVVEYRARVDTANPLVELAIELETTPGSGPDLASRVAAGVRDRLHFRASVTVVPPGTLPRFEMKARRIIR